ncbi:MAG TPA: type II secretion system F family protein [Planctomycetota bacterium]|nr:type II secretion system F family protein [Planctomycetota bacterium]
MLLSIAGDERAALHFDDLASALDAGLPLHHLGGDAKAGDRVLHDILKHRGVVLSPTEDAVLAAGWRAGRAGAALRSRGVGRRNRAEFARTIWAGLRYPLVMFALVLVASFVTGRVVGHYWYAVAVAALAAAAVVFMALARRGLRSGNDRWTRVPILGRIATDLGELPYLETLHALYAAGVPLAQAHPAAVAAVPLVSLQRRLQVADRVLQGGRSLTESLAQALALHAETRSLLATGEHAGQLEEALQRSLVRRREVAGREIGTMARTLTTATYVLAIAFVIGIVFTFYFNYFGKLGRI